MTDLELHRMSLEALEDYEPNEAQRAITALRERLAQPEQHQDWCASLTQMLLSMPPKPAPCNCKPAQPEQEPVAWIGRGPLSGEVLLTDTEPDALVMRDFEMVPLYTAPQRREWVGLTGEELDLIARTADDLYAAALKAEAKLREKNT